MKLPVRPPPFAQRLPPRERRLLVLCLVFAGLVLTGLVQFAGRVYALRARRAVGPSWSFPSRIYSDALVLEPGRVLPPAYLAAELDARGYRQTDGPPDVPGTWAETTDGLELVVRGFSDSRDPAGTGGPERVRLT